jgi:hypothetical protein
MIKQLILAGVLSAPVISVQKAQERYGALDKDYRMVNESKWIVPFSFRPFGLKYETRVNRDIVLPLTLVLTELQATNLLTEIQGFQGCFASRPVRGTNRPSIHAYGLGCDFNHTRFSSGFVKVWKKWGFTWGGDFCSWKDWMHFSWGWEKGKCPTIGYFQRQYLEN